MKLKMFAVYDQKAEAYMNPFVMQTKGQAIRAWSDTVNNDDTQFFKHPEDFTLFELAEYDDSTGAVTMHQAKVDLGNAIQYRKQLNLPGVAQLPLPTATA